MAKLLPTQVVIGAFLEEGAADAIADTLKELRSAGEVFYTNTAVIRKGKDTKLYIKESGEIKPSHGAFVGGFIGGMAGVFFGPATAAAGAAAGAAIGGASAASIETLDHDKLKQIGDVLQPGNSAIIAVFDEVPIEKSVWKEVSGTRDEIAYQLAKDVGETLRSGQNVTYIYAVQEGEVVMTRTALGEEALDIKGLVVSKEGVAVGRAGITDSMIAYEGAAFTAEGAAYEAGVVTEEGAAGVSAAAQIDKVE